MATGNQLVVLGFALWGSMAFAADKTYVHSFLGSASILDPVPMQSYYESVIVGSIFDTLYSYKYLKLPYEIKPNLAESMPSMSQDGKTLTIKLKAGVFFADDPAFKDGKGREVVAQDFVYSIKRHLDSKNHSNVPGNFDNIEGVEVWAKSANYDDELAGLKALDRHTLKIQLKKANPHFVHTLVDTRTAVVPREAVEKYGAQFAIHPVGSGPFKLKSLDATNAVLVKNPTYRKEVLSLKDEGFDPAKQGIYDLDSLDGQAMPFVDSIIIKFMPQAATRWASFTKGDEIQYAVIPPDQATEYLAKLNPPTLKPKLAEKYVLKPETELGVSYATFNMQSPRFGHATDGVENAKHRALRCAIRKAFDWQQRIDRFYFGLGKAYAGAISPGLPDYTELPKESVTQDIVGAKKLLKEAGWTSESLPDLIYGATSAVTERQAFEQFRGWLKRIDYPVQKIKLKTAANFADYVKSVNEGDFDFFAMGWVPSFPDPQQLLERYYSPNAAPGSNKAKFANAEFDKLYEQVEFMPNGADRAALLRKMNEILINECVAVESFSRTNLHVWHRNVKMDYTQNMLRDLFKYIAVR